MKLRRNILKKYLVFLFATLLVFQSGLTTGLAQENINDHWAEQNLIRAMELDWIQGYEDGTLRPENKITRAEFIVIVQRILGQDPRDSIEDSRYLDLEDIDWAYEELKNAEKLGLMDIAFPGERIQGSEPISRGQATVVLDSALSLKNILKEEDLGLKDSIDKNKDLMAEKSTSITDPEVLDFNDRYQINQSFLASIRDLTNSNIIQGYEDNTFKAQGDLTRAESVTLLLRAFGQEPITPEYSELELVEEDGKFYLRNLSSGQLLLRSQFDDGLVDHKDNKYLLSLDGSLKSDFYKNQGKSYYIDGKNGLVKGWKGIDGNYYYFSPYDNRMYAGGLFSTGPGVYWFDDNGAVKEGNRPGGHKGKEIFWAYPNDQELSNSWLEGEDQELRFRGQEIANFSAAHEGLPFRWYGTDLTDGSGVYCCGNTYSAHRAFDIHIPGPDDVDMKKHKGYEMVRAQYEDAESYGGRRIPADFSQAWPGDLVFLYNPRFYLGYNHVGIYMGQNNGRPIYCHATIRDGLIVEDVRQINRDFGYRLNDNIIRYNTYENLN